MKNGTGCILWCVPTWKRIIWCHRHVMSCSNAYILTYVRTVVSTFIFEWDNFSSESINAKVSRKTTLVIFPHTQPERGAGCGNQHCGVWPTSSSSSSSFWSLVALQWSKIYFFLPVCAKWQVSAFHAINCRFMWLQTLHVAAENLFLKSELSGLKVFIFTLLTVVID